MLVQREPALATGCCECTDTICDGDPVVPCEHVPPTVTERVWFCTSWIENRSGVFVSTVSLLRVSPARTVTAIPWLIPPPTNPPPAPAVTFHVEMRPELPLFGTVSWAHRVHDPPRT